MNELRMFSALKNIKISKYGDGGQLITRSFAPKRVRPTKSSVHSHHFFFTFLATLSVDADVLMQTK